MSDYKNLQNGSDIRGVALDGVAGETVNLTPQIACDIAAAFGRFLSTQCGKPVENLTVSVGRDSRLSGPALDEGVTRGLTSMNIRVASCGLASTPAMFMSTVLPDLAFDGGIMITASHLPKNRNGLKFFTKNGGLEKDEIAAILADCVPTSGELRSDRVFACSLIEAYSAHLRDIIRKGVNSSTNYEKPLTGFKIAVDAGNGAGGFFAAQVLGPLGADYSGSVFLEPDGNFPNHIPNPENKEAMAAICKAVTDGGCDLGIIFDTDVDRAAAVDSEGREISRNRLIALMSSIVAEDAPGSVIVTDSVTSSQLKVFIEQELGCVHHRFKRGYKNVINESIRLNNAGKTSLLAIETSGHGALRENYFLDDGAYLSAKIIIKLAKLREQGQTLGSLLCKLEDPLEAGEFRIKIDCEDFKAYGAKVLEDLTAYAASRADWQPANDNYEGLRADVPAADGWFLLRLSLHDPQMPLNIESNKEGGIAAIAAMLRDFLKNYPKLILPASL
ncbi:MAG: phosphomannomutase/phosphoglucomutase [Angelakisella sp.]